MHALYTKHIKTFTVYKNLWNFILKPSKSVFPDLQYTGVL